MLWEQGVGSSNLLAPPFITMGYGLGRNPLFGVASGGK